MLAVALPKGMWRGRPERGRRATQPSAPQVAVLLAVLVLSAAAPGAAARDQPKEAGPTGCATVDCMAWADVPKEARAIFDTNAPKRRVFGF